MNRRSRTCPRMVATVVCGTEEGMRIRKNLTWSLLIVLLITFGAGVLSLSVAAQSDASSNEQASGYNQPPKNILDVMHAPSPPVPQVSPTQDTILLVSWQDYPPISRVATPFLRLAGVRVEPKNHSKHDTPGGYGITLCSSGFALVRAANGTQIPVDLPAGACPGRPIWAADGKRF